MGEFKELVSGFLREKMQIVESGYGKDSPQLAALEKQYIKSPLEDIDYEEHNRRHYEADLDVEETREGGHHLRGMERLYNRTIVVEPTLACISHCRYCLRGNYDYFLLTEEDLDAIAGYCGTVGKETGVEEILVTGGDPFLIPQKLEFFISKIREKADNIRLIRIATRLLTHDPNQIDDRMFAVFDKADDNLRFEVATQINHPVEFFPETIEKIKEIQQHNVRIYSQNVLLKGVNDNIDALVELYTLMHRYGIESHYLFHCVPLKGMHHFRTSVGKGMELARELTSGGRISGRAKPMYSLMTDVGKVTLYDGAVIGKENGALIIKTGYKYEDRMRWNPSWKLPETAFIDNDGRICVRYLDGSDD